MSIQIGKQKLAIARGAEFEARLLESTGCSLAEHAGFLAGNPTAYSIARVLHPMLTEPMPIGDLSVAIEAAGTDGVRQDVLALVTAAPDPTTKGKADGGA